MCIRDRSRDGKGRTPRDLVRLGDAIGHRIHSMLLAAEDAAMGLTDGFVDVGLTRPEDIVEQLQWVNSCGVFVKVLIKGELRFDLDLAVSDIQLDQIVVIIFVRLD